MTIAQTILADHLDDQARWAAAEAVALTIYLTVDRDAQIAVLVDGSAIANNGGLREVTSTGPGRFIDDNGVTLAIW